MKPSPNQSPSLDDASVRKATGKTLGEWYAVLDGLGGTKLGRRDLTQALHGVQPLDAWWLVTIVVEYERERGVVEKDGKPKGYGICVTKTIAAPVPKVFAAFADGKTWSKWFGTGAKADVKDGGKFSSADGDAGTFKKVRTDKDIKLTWENPRHQGAEPVEIVFQAKPNDKCVIMVNHNRIPTRAMADDLRDGWGDALDKLKKLVEG